MSIEQADIVDKFDRLIIALGHKPKPRKNYRLQRVIDDELAKKRLRNELKEVWE